MITEFTEANNLLKALNELDDSYYERYREKYYENEIFPIFSEHRDALITLMLFLATGEKDFWKLYERFGSPAHPEGKPIAWGPEGFIPDAMYFVMSDDKLTAKLKFRKIKELYKECMKAEKAHKKARKVKKSKKNDNRHSLHPSLY